MTETLDIEHFRGLLEVRLAELRGLIDGARDQVKPVELDQTSVGRLSRMDAMQVQAMAQETERRRHLDLQRVQAALERLAGTTLVIAAHRNSRPWQGETLFHGVHRRQDLPPAHVPDGGVMVVRRDALFAPCESPHDFLGSKRAGVVTREGEVIDIDSEIDLLVADAVLRGRAGAST